MKETIYKEGDDEETPKKEQTEEQKVQTKTVNPRGFFQDLIKKKDPTKAPAPAPAQAPAATDEDDEKDRKVADFKKKLRLDNIDS